MINIFAANIAFKKIGQVIDAISLYYDSQETLSEFKPLDPFQTFGVGKNNVDGFYYFAAMTKGGPPLNRSHYVFKYDKATNEIVEQIHIPKHPDIISSFDVHPIPVIQFDANGHIYMIVEKCKDSNGWSDGHNTSILIYKTGTAGVLSTMSLWKTISGFFSYPRMWINGSTYYMMARGAVAASNLTRLSLQKSTDSGTTWTQYMVLDTSQVPVRRMYFNSVMNFDNNDLAIVINARNEGEAVFESVSFMRSPDGINWSNASGNFTRNVSTGGMLNLTELEATMLIWKVDPTLHQVNFEGGCIKNGAVKILVSKSEVSTTVVDGNRVVKYIELRLYTSKNGAWTYVDVSQILPPDYSQLWALERTLQYVPSLTEDCIFVLDRRNTADVKLYEYKSLNGFQSFQKRTVFQGEGNYYYGSHAFNSTTLDEQLIILNDVQGVYNNNTGSSNLRIINP